MTETEVFGGNDRPQRPLWKAMARGWHGRCPSCGKGRLFSDFLSTVEHCPSCGEHIASHRADDLPPYLNIFIVGHIVVGAMLVTMRITDWSTGTHLAIWTGQLH